MSRFALLMSGISCLLATLLFADRAAAADDASQHVFYLSDDRLVVIRLHLYINGKPYRTAWSEFLATRFRELDANEDGVLTGDEMLGIPSRNQLVQLGLVSQSREDLIADFAPADGKVTREELASYFDRIGLQAFQVRIALQETRQGRVRFGTTSAEQAPKILFERLDANGDGGLSAAEFLAAEHVLRKFDLDRDGAIGSAELSQSNPYEAFAAPMGYSNETKAARFVAVAAGQSPRFLVQQLLTAYDGRKQPVSAKAADGRLTRDELGLSAEAFIRFDGDGDGKLDFEETMQLLKQPVPDVELVVRIGERSGKEEVLEFLGNQSGRVKESLASLVIGSAQMEFAVDEVGDADVATRLRQAFKSRDTDGNGYVDTMEAQRIGVDSARLSLFDRDSDGKVFVEEFLALALPLAKMDSFRVRLSVTDRGHDLFKILDLNGDNQLGLREFRAARERMVHWDANGDGLVQGTEIPIISARGKPQ